MFFKKKDSHVNIYEAHADERLYDLWAERDRLMAKAREVITRKAVIRMDQTGTPQLKRRSAPYFVQSALMTLPVGSTTKEKR